MPELAAQLRQTITLETSSGRNVENAPTFNAPVTVAAAVSWRIQTIKDRAGEQVVSAAQATVPPDTAVDYDTRVTLPDGTTSRILRIGRIPHPLTGAIDHLTLWME